MATSKYSRPSHRKNVFGYYRSVTFSCVFDNSNELVMETLKTNISKTYSSITIHHEKWNEAIQNTETSLKSLSSLNDQLECVHKTQSCELMRKFPFLKNRLEQIIHALIEEELTNIFQTLEELAQLNHQLRNSCDGSYKSFLEDFSKIQNDHTFFQRTHLYPSPSEMIEWINDINICYGTWLSKARHMLEMFNFTSHSVTNLQNILDTTYICSSIESILVKMSLFLQEK